MDQLSFAEADTRTNAGRRGVMRDRSAMKMGKWPDKPQIRGVIGM